MLTCYHPHHSKQPVDPVANGYTLDKQEYLEDNTWHIWKVNNSTNTIGYLAKIGVDPVNNRICVFDVSTDSDKFPADKRLKLRDFLIGIWALKQGKQPGDLHSVIFQNVVREDTQNICDEVRTLMMKTDKTAPLPIKAVGTTPEEKKAAKLLKNTPFAKGVQKMLAEYEDLNGKKMQQYVLVQPRHQGLQVEIVIG